MSNRNPLGSVWPEKRLGEGLQMYLEALEKASWSLFSRSLEEDLKSGDEFKDENQER